MDWTTLLRDKEDDKPDGKKAQPRVNEERKTKDKINKHREKEEERAGL